MKKLLGLFLAFGLITFPISYTFSAEEQTEEVKKEEETTLYEQAEDQAKEAAEAVKDGTETAAEKTQYALGEFGRWLDVNLWQPIQNLFTGEQRKEHKAEEAPKEEAQPETTPADPA